MGTLRDAMDHARNDGNYSNVRGRDGTVTLIRKADPSYQTYGGDDSPSYAADMATNERLGRQDASDFVRSTGELLDSMRSRK